MRQLQQPLSGWGLYPTSNALISRPEKFSQFPSFARGKFIARGLGRSYGDAALNADHDVILMERMDRFLAFDETNGLLTTEAGVSIEEILNIFVPRGWFLPVTPGTKYVTLGGAVAADVHGKNHHVDGTIGAHVKTLKLLLADGSVRKCSPEHHPDLFWATVGGMGLTGIITEITLQLIPIETAYMSVRHLTTPNLEKTLELFESKATESAPYSVAWIDCLAKGKNFGRSVVMLGDHATKNNLPRSIKDPLRTEERSTLSLPFHFPENFLNPWSIRTFNALYHRSQRGKEEPFLVDYDRYFYPLDTLHNWGPLYGKRGFVQYQCVLPSATSHEGLKALLDELVMSKRGSFLAVLKRFGAQGPGMLSFPHEGYTLALDIPVSNPNLFPFLDHLDAVILKHGGRTYLAKDARMKPRVFREMYPRFEEWLQIKNEVDPDGHFSSDLSRRLQIGEKA